MTEEIKEITLAGGVSESVVFTTSQDEADTYSVDVNGLPGLFTVEAATLPPLAPTPTPTLESETKPSWWLIGGIIAAVVMAISIPLTLKWRRRRNEYSSFDKFISS